MTVNIADLWRYELREGNTDDPANGACLYDAAMWLVYGRIGDNPPCSCPVIRTYAIGLNDRMDHFRRQWLKPFILRVVGNLDQQVEEARCRYIILETARQIVPLVVPECATEMRAFPDDIGYGDLYVRLVRLTEIATDGFAVECAANAAKRAIVDIVLAVNNASIVASRVAGCLAGSVGRDQVWRTAINILDGALRIGKQSPEFDEGEVREAIERFDAARQLVSA